MADLPKPQQAMTREEELKKRFSDLSGVPVGFVPLPTNVTGEPEGSLWTANFRDSTTIGAFINSHSSRELNAAPDKTLNLQDALAKIPEDLVLDYADRYINVKPEKFDDVTTQIRRELNDKQLIASHPWKSFAVGMVEQPLDPVNWLPMGALFKNVKAGSKLARAIVGSGAATAAGATVQEAIISKNQMTREIEESVMNIAVSGIIGGALGGIGVGFAARKKPTTGEPFEAGETTPADTAEKPAAEQVTSITPTSKSQPDIDIRDVETIQQGIDEGRFVTEEEYAVLPMERREGIAAVLTIKDAGQVKARQRARKEVMDVMTDKDKELDANGLLKEEDLFNIPKPIRKAMNITPMNQLLNSSFGTSKFFANSMFEHGYTLLKHLDERTDGASVETLTRLDIGKTKSMMVDYQDIFFDMNGISSGPFKGTRAKLQGIQIPLDQFNERVWRRLSSQVDDPQEHVNRAARLLEDGLFNKTRDKAIELGLLTEQDAPRNAPGYIMSVYNKNKIIEQGGKHARGAGTFPQFLHEKFKEIQRQIESFKESPLYKENIRKIEENDRKIKRLEKSKEQPKEEIERLKEDIATLEEEIKNAAPPKGLDSEGNLFPVVDDKTLWAHVEQTIDHILGDNEGQLLNPILSRLKGGTKPLKQRKMTVTQEDMMEWHITDIPKIVEMYSRAMHPMIRLTEFAQKHGAKDIPEMRELFSKLISDEFEEQVKDKTGKEAAKLRRQRDKDVENMKATLDLLMGVYGDGPNVLNDSARQYYQNFLKWNYIRLLGYMTISSIADAGAQVFAHGPYRFIHEGLVETFSEARKIAKEDLRAIGYAIETELGSRIKSYAEHQGLSTNPSPFTKGLDALTQNFGNLSLMNQWNTWQQSMAGHIGINRTLQTIHKVAKGEKVSDKEIRRVVRLGLDKKHFKTIFEFTKDNNSDGTLYADWTNWNIETADQREALEQFQASIAKEIDNIVIVPGLGDKPLLAQKPIGKLLFQFKSFLMASTNRLLYSGISRGHDLNTYLGIISMLGMGAMSYVATSLIRGDEPDLSFSKLSREALDKSGLLGIWGEVGNIASKLSGIGVASRYQSRDFVGALSGPTSGAISELATIMNKITQASLGHAEVTTKDAEKVARLFPMQNLFYIHWLQRQAVKGAAKNLGAIDTDDK